MEVPGGCAARSWFIHEQAKELGRQFDNGNYSVVHNALMDMPQEVAIAVTATISACDCAHPDRFATVMLEKA